MTLPREAVEAALKAWRRYNGAPVEESMRLSIEAALPFLPAHSAEARPMTVTDEAVKFLPLRYEDGPDYCTVTDKNGSPFALTLRPEILKQMEAALLAAAPLMSAHSAEEPAGWRPISDESMPPHGEPVLLWSPPSMGHPEGLIEARPFSTGQSGPGWSERSYHSWASHWQPLPSPPVKE